MFSPGFPLWCLFINVGRAQAVDETALLSALDNNNLAGAVLDVFLEEPLPLTHPFWKHPKVQMTFHTSAPSFPHQIINVFSENYSRIIAGDAPLHLIDFQRGY